MFRQQWVSKYIRTIERLMVKDNLTDTDYYRMYEKALDREDLEYVLTINLNSEHGGLIREYMRLLDRWLKSK